MYPRSFSYQAYFLMNIVIAKPLIYVINLSVLVMTFTVKHSKLYNNVFLPVKDITNISKIYFRKLRIVR